MSAEQGTHTHHDDRATVARHAVAADAAALDQAQRTASPIAGRAAGAPSGLDAAYATQHALIARRTDRGERVVGVKLGFTSRAKAEQMGVADVILGTLTDAMGVDDHGRYDPRTAIHPRVEPEVAYLLGPGVEDELAEPDPSASIAAVAPALEVIDSRYRDFRFSLDDVVADNASAAAFAIGPWRRPADTGPMDNRAVSLEFDGRLVQAGSTAAILGDPGRAIAAARRLAGRHGFALRAGMILLAGAATAAVPLPATGVVGAEIAGLGRVSLRVGDGARTEAR
ncbi:2-keto-4-pentenoate hydratase [Agromyces aurantiacus]|uniref:2-keto-4-pentenoate hydratase n=1 Tax=Agromyces aurantiacus TaxID=165814 RepID=A0ABV9R260_9MICO|nr:fumarylacetoacetate hydrolase family protein [Agromyces aurantiacus]MBM7502598.1 2-oxo-3-hexenedioate decarboxylase [Agromyces aurantiacus]